MQTIGDKQTEYADEPNMFISFCLDIQDTCVNFVTAQKDGYNKGLDWYKQGCYNYSQWMIIKSDQYYMRKKQLLDEFWETKDFLSCQNNFCDLINHSTIPENRKAVGDWLYGGIIAVCLMEQNEAKNEKNGEKG